MASGDLSIVVRVKAEITLWQAIKLRLAGAEAVKHLLEVYFQDRHPEDRDE